MVYTILDSATVLKSSKLPLVQESDEITIEQPTATASGTDTYTATIEGIESYETGLIVGILFTNANTGSSTLNINSLGAKTLKKSVSTNLAASDISAGQALLLYYDGTNFQVIGLGGGGSGSGTVNSGTQYRLAYYATTGTAVSEASAITASRALKSDANGVPTHFDTTTEPSLTELSYVKGVTSAIQTQIDSKLSTGLAWLLESGGTLSGNNEIIGTSRTFTMTWNSLGTTQTDGYGIWLRNTTAAAAGAQQISPSLVLEGNGWKTNATASSQSVKWRLYTLPVQGAANPTTRLLIGFSINGAAYSTSAYFNNISTTTNLNIDSITGLGGGSALSFAAGQSFGSTSSQLQFLTLGGTSPVTSFYLNATSNLSATSGEQSLVGFSVGSTGGTQSIFAPTSGTAKFNNLNMRPIINQTGGANGDVRMINIESSYTAVGGNLYAFRYAPAVTSITGQHFAGYHNSGFIAWDSILTPAQITSNQNDYAPNGWNNSSAAPYGASILRLSTDASRDLTGLTGGVSGRLVIISNVGTQDLVIKDENAGSTAANRFALNADITIQPDEGLMFWYDATSSRWRALSI